MLRKLLDGDRTMVSISRKPDQSIAIVINDDLTDHRKERVSINEDRVASDLNLLWNSLKKSSSKLKGIFIGFDEIDWYDSMTNIYGVPWFKTERGKRKVTVGYNDHGSIPKAWFVGIYGYFQPGKVKKPYMNFINGVLTNLNQDQQKAIEKELGRVLSGKSNHVIVELT